MIYLILPFTLFGFILFAALGLVQFCHPNPQFTDIGLNKHKRFWRSVIVCSLGMAVLCVLGIITIAP